MSTIITTENAIVNEVMNEVTVVNTATKKSFPSKHIKYLSYALYIMKQVYPDKDTCVEKFVEHLHLSESIEYVMNEIDNAVTPELENEVREIKRNLNKKPKRKRAPAKKGSVPVQVEENITEQIVSLASEPIIQRGPVEQKGESVQPKVVPAKKTKTRAKKTMIDDYDPDRPSPAFLPDLPKPVSSDSDEDKVEEVLAQAELPKKEVIVQTEVIAQAVKEVAPKKTKVTKTKVKKDEVVAEVTIATEVVAQAVKEVAPKKTKVTKTKVNKDEVVAEVTVATEVPVPEKKVAKAKVPRVAKAKAPATIEEPAPFTEELVEEPEQ